jgi:hypothetical protein
MSHGGLTTTFDKHILPALLTSIHRRAEQLRIAYQRRVPPAGTMTVPEVVAPPVVAG